MGLQGFGKRVKQKIKVLKLYRKGSNKVFCEIEIPNKEYFDNIYKILFNLQRLN